jgi:hypothetical protein
MIRKGSLVQFNPAATKNPLYSSLAQAGLRWKVQGVAERAGRKFAIVGEGILLPAAALIGVPQKKGRSVMGRAVTA